MPVQASVMRTPGTALIPVNQHAGKPAIALTRPVYLIGSRSNARIHLQSSTVSKAHALLVQAPNHTYIRDLASRTHVFVNGEQVREAVLKDGDLVAIGRFTFKYQGPKDPQAKEVPAAPAMLHVSGAELPVPLEGRVTLIGRRTTSDIPLLEDSVSTSHAVIFQWEGKRFIRDLGSRTGTFVNGEQIHEIELHAGDEIRIGETEIRYTPSTERGSVAVVESASDSMMAAASSAEEVDLALGLEPAPPIASEEPVAAAEPELEPLEMATDAVDEPPSMDELLALEPVEAVEPPVSEAADVPLAPVAEDVEQSEALPLSPEAAPIMEAAEEPPPAAEAEEPAPIEEIAGATEPVLDDPLSLELLESLEPEITEASSDDTAHIPIALTQPEEESTAPDSAEVALNLTALSDALARPVENSSIELPTADTLVSATVDQSVAEVEIALPKLTIETPEAAEEVDEAEATASEVEQSSDVLHFPQEDSLTDGSAGSTAVLDFDAPALDEQSEFAQPIEIETSRDENDLQDLGISPDSIKADSAFAAPAEFDVDLSGSNFGEPISPAAESSSDADNLIGLADEPKADTQRPLLSFRQVEEIEETESEPTRPLISASVRDEVASIVEPVVHEALSLAPEEILPAAVDEVIDPTEPTPQSALDLSAADEIAPEEVSEATELSDTSFGRAVQEFEGESLGPIIEQIPEPADSTEPAVEIEPVVELEPAAESEPAVEFEPTAEVEPAAESEPASDLRQSVETDPVFEVEPAVDVEPAVEVEPVVNAEPIAEAAPALEMEPVLENEPAVETEQAIAAEQSVDFEPLVEPAASVELLAINTVEAIESLEPENVQAEQESQLEATGFQPTIPQLDEADVMDFLADESAHITQPIPVEPQIVADSSPAITNSPTELAQQEALPPLADELIAALSELPALEEPSPEPVDEMSTHSPVSGQATFDISDLARMDDAVEPISEVAAADLVSEETAKILPAPDSSTVTAVTIRAVLRPSHRPHRLESPQLDNEPVATEPPPPGGIPTLSGWNANLGHFLGGMPIDLRKTGLAAPTTTAPADAGQTSSQSQTVQPSPAAKLPTVADEAPADEPSSPEPVAPAPKIKIRTDGPSRLRKDGKPRIIRNGFGQVKLNSESGDSEALPFADSKSKIDQSASLTGLAAPSAREADVFSESVSSSALTGADVFSAASSAAARKRNTALRKPRSSAGGTLAAAERLRADVQLGENSAESPDVARPVIALEDESAAIASAQRRRKLIRRAPTLMLIMLALMGAVWAGCWYFLPVKSEIRATINYRNFDSLTEWDQHTFEREQISLLCEDSTRKSAARFLVARHGNIPAGFLDNPDQYLSLVGHHETTWTNGKKGELVLRYDGTEDFNDRARVEAVALALYDANSQMVNGTRSLKTVLDELNSRIQNSARLIEDYKKQAEHEQAVYDARPTLDQLKKFQADDTTLETAYTQAIAKVMNLEADIDQVKLDQARDDASAAGDVVAKDEQLQQMSKQADDLASALTAARNERAELAARARVSLDEAYNQFKLQADAAQSVVKSSPELTKFFTDAQNLQQAFRDVTDRYIQHLQDQYTRLNEVKSQLAAKIQEQRASLFAGDQKLRDLTEQKEILTRKYNAAAGSGMDKEAADLQNDLKLTETSIKAQQDIVANDPFSAGLLNSLQQVLDQSQRDIKDMRTKTDQQLAALKSNFNKSAAAVEKLPSEQKELASQMQERLIQIDAARRQYAEAASASVGDADSSIQKMVTELQDLKTNIDTRKKQLLAVNSDDSRGERRQKRDKQVIEKNAQLENLNKELADARSAYEANHTTLIKANTAKLEGEASKERVDEIKVRREAAEQQIAQSQREWDQKKKDLDRAVDPIEPTDADVRTIGKVDNRQQFALYGSGAIFIFFTFWIMMTLMGAARETHYHYGPTFETLETPAPPKQAADPDVDESDAVVA